MTTREELQHLTLSELEKAYNSLVECLQLLNNNDDRLSELSLSGKDMTLQLELAKMAMYGRILELEK